MITDITEHREFQNSLKPGDIIYKFNIFYKFIRFNKCNYQSSIKCSVCKGRYLVKNLTSNEIYNLIGCMTFIKMEEFISEEEFSV